MPAFDTPTVQIVYTRLPGDVRRYTQELLYDGPACKITLMRHGLDASPLRIGEAELEPGGAVMWFVFPGRAYEIASVYDRNGGFLGHYTNLIRAPNLETGVWSLTDLFLDIWQPPDRTARLLDEDELEAAVESGVVDAQEASAIRAEATAVLRAARANRWPPGVVTRHRLDDAPSLRYRRDAPGMFFANLITGRVIAFGIYALGAISLTSVVFAALTDAFLPGGSPARRLWLGTIVTELVVLLTLALAGRLPATRRPRPEEAVTERILVIGTVVAGAAVLLYPDGRLWRAALAGLYIVLAVFLAIFAVSRARFDRRFPALAITGLLVCLIALVVLL